jgi:small-conductance mechanosensitive channel
MLLRWLWLLLFILPLALPRAAAHAETKPVADARAALTPEQARAALDTLNDPKKRAALEATLQAIAQTRPMADTAPSSQAGVAQSATPQPAPTQTEAAAPASAPTPASGGIAIQLAPNSLGAQLLLTSSTFLTTLAADVPRALQTIQSLPLLWGWIVVMVTSPLGHHLLADAAWRLAATLALALGTAEALRYLLRRPMARVIALGQLQMPPPAQAEEGALARAERGATEPPPLRRDVRGIGRRLGLALARFVLRMVPILGLLLIGHAAAASDLGGLASTRLVILAVLEAIVACQVLLALLTLFFEPDPPGLKLLSMRPSAGAYLVRWGWRMILIVVPGYTIGEIGLLLGLSPLAHAAWQKAVGLVLVICLGIIAVQRRRPVRRWLSAPADSSGVIAQLRDRLAKFWYWIALLFLAVSWLSWTLRAPDAVGHTMWYFGVTAAVIAGATLVRIIVTTLLGPLRSMAAADPAAATPADTIRSRLGAYHPALSEIAYVLINIFALLGLLQLYGFGGLSWLLTTEIGQRVGSGFVTLAVTIGLALAVWEGVNIAILMRMASLRREAQAARSARLRTLLPLIRTSLAITVAVVAGLMVLSEIGVNIAPLLAGAGIVGVAIGFGSQKLVQDVITGVFLLLENTMQVGDIVKVGDQSGLVESLSVRTIRLRTEDGSVVVIPFSAVTTVINMTRDYSRAVIAIPIAIGEDVDLVIEAMRAIVREMRSEDAWSTIILDDLEVFGVDQFTNSAVVIKCRIMCMPFGRWPVGREFNRRLKGRFEDVGISSAASALKLMPSVSAPPQASEVPESSKSDADPDTVSQAAQ